MALKKIFTTGEVARLLGININTVIKWFDEGRRCRLAALYEQEPNSIGYDG
jgi:hypothetical protein